MKIACAFVGVVLMCGNAFCGGHPIKEKPDKLSLGNIDWRLYIRPDGSGQLMFGSSDFTILPSGLLDFESLWRQVSDSNLWSTTQSGARVGFEYKDHKKDWGCDLKDLTLWTNLVDRVLPEGHPMREIMKTHPIDGSEPKMSVTLAPIAASASQTLLRELKREGLTSNLCSRAMALVSTNDMDSHTDDLALILLTKVAARAEDNSGLTMKMYRACTRNKELRCGLDSDTTSVWNDDLSRLKDMGSDLAGGDEYLLLVAKANVLGCLKKHVERARRNKKTTGLDAIEAFIRQEAQNLADNFPEPPLKALLKQMAEGKSPDMDAAMSGLGAKDGATNSAPVKAASVN